jgi:hypothetical protein
MRLSTVLTLLLAIVITFFSSGCRNDNGEQLFVINYPIQDFNLPPGIPSFQSFVVARANVASLYEQALSDNNVSMDEVDEVGGFFARITSLSGEDFGQLREVDLRICPVAQPNGCDQFDILFSVDDLYLRRDLILNLNPGLRNFKELVSSGNYRMELVFVFAETSSQSIDCRLEWSIRGVSRD